MDKNSCKHYGNFMNVISDKCNTCKDNMSCYLEWNNREKLKRRKVCKINKSKGKGKSLEELYPEICEECG